ncbi:PIN domain-containing protein [Synechococcales cyanobacterium C]|uniref:PIN domain-containing protein n=1 Tax=Petrachloros mirabilis ULC683 TaxID=2781853 RepID=A0A8K1ZWB3_9CYAN|nr:type II toxin-antitoxin system VapC family toxin [Petrachloros mirabilis]NCJ05292.1 PIN domain-containing protein [Petrachloros mirabilis ULC683]
MSLSPTFVLDASALLAYLQGEAGSDLVATALTQGTALSAVNWAEVLSKLLERGKQPQDVVAQLRDLGLLSQAIQIYPVEEALALTIAELLPKTRAMGLSLGDRACLALALKLNLPALTSDKVWRNVDVGVSVRLIR